MFWLLYISITISYHTKGYITLKQLHPLINDYTDCVDEAVCYPSFCSNYINFAFFLWRYLVY